VSGRKRQAGDDRPGDHDAADPDPGTETMQQQVAGNLEQEVAEKEDAGPEPVRGVGEVQVLRHLQLGEADIHPVDVGEQPGQHQQWQQTPGYTCVELIFIDRYGQIRFLRDRFCGQRRWRQRLVQTIPATTAFRLLVL
jgi:hypothetical protein